MAGDQGAPGRESSISEISRLLDRIRHGDGEARATLYKLAYAELRRLAAGYLRQQKPGHTLQPSDLVHEAYLKLSGTDDPARNRTHFFALAARAMRQVLVDHARRKQAAKRGGEAERVTLRDSMGLAGERPHAIDLLDLEAALVDLGTRHERQRQIVELRFFAGFTIAETAEILGVSTDTVEDDTAVARTWLRRKLRES